MLGVLIFWGACVLAGGFVLCIYCLKIVRNCTMRDNKTVMRRVGLNGDQLPWCEVDIRSRSRPHKEWPIDHHSSVTHTLEEGWKKGNPRQEEMDCLSATFTNVLTARLTPSWSQGAAASWYFLLLYNDRYSVSEVDVIVPGFAHSRSDQLPSYFEN